MIVYNNIMYNIMYTYTYVDVDRVVYALYLLICTVTVTWHARGGSEMAECANHSKRKSAEQVVTSISLLAKKFVESERSANNIVDILNYLQVSIIKYSRSRYIFKYSGPRLLCLIGR